MIRDLDHQRVLAVPCPFCGAAAKQKCHYKEHPDTIEVPHTARTNAYWAQER